jgi:hypothetical protein
MNPSEFGGARNAHKGSKFWYFLVCPAPLLLVVGELEMHRQARSRKSQRITFARILLL